MMRLGNKITLDRSLGKRDTKLARTRLEAFLRRGLQQKPIWLSHLVLLFHNR